MTLYVEAGFDLAVVCGRAGAALSFTLTETGGGGASGTVSITEGTYFVRTDGSTISKPDGEGLYELGYADLPSALQAACNAIGNATYVWDFDPTVGKYRVTAAGGGVTAFALASPSSVAQKWIGMTTTHSGGLDHTMDRSPWGWIATSQGILSDYFWNEEEDGEAGDDLRSHAAEVYGISEDELPILFNATIPLEPKEALWNRWASAAAPFTWERLFRHVRNVEPVLLDFTDGDVTSQFFVRFRRDGRIFRPLPRPSKNLWSYGDVPIAARLIGTL